jgi:hypothetical protein
VRHTATTLAQQKAFFWHRGKHTPSAHFHDYGHEISVWIRSENGEFEAALTFCLAVAARTIATVAAKYGQDVVFKVKRLRRAKRLCPQQNSGNHSKAHDMVSG